MSPTVGHINQAIINTRRAGARRRAAASTQSHYIPHAAADAAAAAEAAGDRVHVHGATETINEASGSRMYLD